MGGSAHSLGFGSLVALVVANMIGAGVYTSSGFALGDLGSKWLVLSVWGIAGAIALLGAVCYGRLVRWLTASGGEYLFLSRAVHPLVGFLAGWISLTAGFSGAIAYSAITFDLYLPSEGWFAQRWVLERPSWLVPVGLILTFGLLHLIRVKVGTSVQNAMVLVKLIFLVGFTLLGLYGMTTGLGNSDPVNPVTIDAQTVHEGLAKVAPVVETTTLEWLGAIATSLMWISFSYAGYNAAVYVAGATSAGESGGRLVARSMWFAAVIVTLLYLGLNAVILFSVPAEQLSYQKDVLNIAAKAVGGLTLERVMGGVILLSLATSVSAMLQIGPHVYAQMAEDGLLPRFLAVAQGGLPRAAIVMQIVLAAVLAIFSDLQQLLDYLGFLLTLSAAMTVAILLLPKFRRASRDRADTGGLIAPVVFVAASLLISALALHYRFQQDPTSLVKALAVVPLGVIAYFVFRRGGQFRRINAKPPL